MTVVLTSFAEGALCQGCSWIVADELELAERIKGFDGLQLELDSASGIVSAAVIFEDKATDNPRKTIRDEVWPEFQLLETGDRENVLSADVSSLLSTRPEIDADKAIENVIWKQIRRYRASLWAIRTRPQMAASAYSKVTTKSRLVMLFADAVKYFSSTNSGRGWHRWQGKPSPF